MTTNTIEAARRAAEKIATQAGITSFLGDNARRGINEIAAIITAEMAEMDGIDIESLAKRIAARAFRMRSNQEIVEYAALEELSATVLLDNNSVESALAALRERYPRGFCEIMFPTESGTEKNYLDNVVIAVWDSSRSNGSLTHYDAPTLAEALDAAMKGE